MLPLGLLLRRFEREEREGGLDRRKDAEGGCINWRDGRGWHWRRGGLSISNQSALSNVVMSSSP